MTAMRFENIEEQEGTNKFIVLCIALNNIINQMAKVVMSIEI